jgi:hypothetical protein
LFRSIGHDHGAVVRSQNDHRPRGSPLCAGEQLVGLAVAKLDRGKTIARLGYAASTGTPNPTLFDGERVATVLTGRPEPFIQLAAPECGASVNTASGKPSLELNGPRWSSLALMTVLEGRCRLILRDTERMKVFDSDDR